MNHLALNGTIRHDATILKYDPFLVRATLVTPGGNYQLLVKKNALDFLYRCTAGATIAVWGHYNGRHQVVVDRFFAKPMHHQIA